MERKKDYRQTTPPRTATWVKVKVSSSHDYDRTVRTSLLRPLRETPRCTRYSYSTTGLQVPCLLTLLSAILPFAGTVPVCAGTLSQVRGNDFLEGNWVQWAKQRPKRRRGSTATVRPYEEATSSCVLVKMLGLPVRTTLHLWSIARTDTV